VAKEKFWEVALLWLQTWGHNNYFKNNVCCFSYLTFNIKEFRRQRRDKEIVSGLYRDNKLAQILVALRY